MKVSRLILFAAVVATGCAHPAQPYVLNNAKGGDAVMIVAKSLVRQGHKLAFVDRKNTELVTYWEDTKYRFRETDDSGRRDQHLLALSRAVPGARQSDPRHRGSAALRSL